MADTKGLFVTFEGIDFSGKTTQISLLRDRLLEAGHEVLVVREPGGTVISEKVRTILLDREHDELSERAEIFLYSAARAQIVDEQIVPALQQGKVILCDRYFDSTTAYQGYGRGLDLTIVDTINAFATNGLEPDITFLLDIAPEAAARRRMAEGAAPDRMEMQAGAFHQRVREGYLHISRKHSHRFRVLDATRATQDLAEEIWETIRRKISPSQQ